MTIPSSRPCAAYGVLAGGARCKDSLSSNGVDLTFYEYLDFLESQVERECVPVPGMNVCAEFPKSESQKVLLPQRGSAVCYSADDYKTLKTSLETACRKLGWRCSYEIRDAISSMGAFE